MRLQPFKLERYFARYEFTAPYLLSSSDCESLSQKELLEMADYDTYKLWENLTLGYTDSLGHPLLRESICGLYERVTSDQILAVVPEEGIFISLQQMLREGDHVVCTSPAYQSLFEVARGMGCYVSKWYADFNGSWKFDLNELKRQFRENTRLLILNFPHNPTGATISRREMDEIVELARQKNILIFSDEMYRYLEHSPEIRLPSFSEVYENAVSLSGLSKSFSLPGLRTGWLITQNEELMARFRNFKDYTTICASAPSEILGIVAVRARDKILARNREIIGNNLNLLNRFFARYPHLFRWEAPQASSIAFPKLADEIPVDRFCHDLVQRAGVLLVPAGMFDYPSNHFRIGYGRRNMPEALAKLEEYLEQPA